MKHLLRNFFSTLRHYRASSVLNIIGMAVAFGAFYVIMTQVRWGFGYNREVPDADRIFVMTTPQDDGKRDVYFCRPLAEQAISSAPGVESYGTISFSADVDETSFYMKDGELVRKFKTIDHLASRSALDVFGFEAVSGSFDDLSKPGAVAVSSGFARKNSLKTGDYLSLSPKGEPANMEIVAIWSDKFQENSSPGSIDLISSLGDQCIDDWSEWSYPYFVKLDSADGKEAVEQSANNTIHEFLKSQTDDQEEIESTMERLKVTLIPFNELYYRDGIAYKSSVCRSGNKTTDTSLIAVAILIILIALINFVNFFFALVPSRVRSVNTYKVFGTSRGTLVADFIMEAVGLTVISLVLAAVGVALLSKSTMTGILTGPMDFASNGPILWLTLAVALVGAVAGSVYPALYITSFQPALVLKGSFGSSKAGRTLRNILIGVQFTISMCLIICAVFVKLQHSYMMDFDMGFNKEYLISGVMPSEVSWWSPKNEAFENKLHSNPDIVDLTWSNGQLVNQSRMGWGREYKDKHIEFQCFPVAYNFLDVMGIEIVEGRDFTKVDEQSETGVLIFNEQARDQFGITLDTKGPGHNGDAEIAGICRDFRFRPLQMGDMPFAFYLFGKDHYWRQQGLTHLYLRTAAGADPGRVMEFVRSTAMELCPDADPDEIELHLFDEELARKYRSEDKLSRQLTGFTLVTIVLALMGVFGLVLFETQRRSREIAVRRVHGAEIRDILGMLNRRFVVITLVCFLVAAPVSWIIVTRYFSGFAYHHAVSWWVFALALLAVLAVTVTIVTLRSLHAASSNPVEHLKEE